MPEVYNATADRAGKHPRETVAASGHAFPSVIAVDASALAVKSSTGIILVKPGELGYWPFEMATTLEEADRRVASAFYTRPPTDAEREAAVIGSVFGWHVPGADPARVQTNVTKRAGSFAQRVEDGVVKVGG